MRRPLLLAFAVVLAATSAPVVSYAQSGRDPEADARRQEEAASKKRKQKEEWGDNEAPLPALKNAGPCPYVKSLYDASRYIDFKDARETSSQVTFTGEIQGVSAGCEYKDDQPIQVTMEVLFELGKGPQAAGRQHSYRYWIAVTDRNRSILAKQSFDLPVTFPEGKDRVYVTEQINQIVIPRATATTSGANFEVLIGFEVTPQMAAFNREGKRFRLNVGQASNTSNP